MAERTTKVSLVAQVSSYVAGMEAAAKKTREVGSEAEKLGQKKKSFEEVGRASIALGAVAAAGIALAIAKYAEFDQAMSQVKAATQETTANMGLLRAAALEAGAKTQYSATEAANAIEELGKAGLTTEQILSGGLDGALTLAAAGGIGVADAAQTAAIAMKQFGLQGSALPHVADLLAAGAGKAVGDVSDLSAALNQAGLVANGAGQSIEDTTGVLAAFADAGLLGSDAGTSLKTAIIALQAPAAKSKEVMDQYGLSFYDANGKMLSFSGIADQLQTHLGDLDDKTRNAALAQIFGNDALRSANVLYKEGADGIQKYIDQTNDSGYAAKVAADRTDNLAGDIERLGGSMDTALIQTGSGANDILRGIVQSVGFLVDSFGSLPQPVLGSALAVGAVAAALALAGGAALIGIPKFYAMKTAMQQMGVTAKGAASAIGLIGGAVTLATLVIGGLVQQSAEQAAMVDSLADSYDKASGKATSYTRELVKQKLAQVGAYEVAQRAGVSQKELTDAVLKGGDALQRMRDKLGGENNVFGVFDGTSLSAYNAAQGVRDLGEAIETSKQQHKDMQAAGAATTAQTEEMAQATEEAAKAQQDWIESVASADASFVDLTGAYDAAVQKAQDLATETGKATGKVGDSLSGMVADAKVSTGDYIAELQKQVDAQNNWESNMVLLAAKVPAGMLKELADLGPKGAAEVQLMTTMTDAELQKTVELWQERGGDMPAAFATELAAAAPTITAVAAKYGQDAVTALSDKIKAGEGLDEAMAELNLTVEGHPPTITPNANTAPALKDFDDAHAYAEAMQVWLHVQGDTVPARAQFQSERDYQQGLQLWLTANGITRPARAEFESAAQYAEALQVYMTALGNTKPARGDFDSAKAYGDALKAWITAVANTEPAEQALEQIANKKRYATINAVISGGTDAGAAKAAYATGGYIVGPGTGTSDSIPARLSNGEYVVNAAATARNRDLLEAINSGGVRRYASGGYVAPPRYVGSSAMAGAPVFNVVVQSKGGVDLLKYVDVRVEASDKSRDTASSMGWSVNR